MSTKKIREALDRLANAYAELKDTPTNNLVGDAYAEVEAIERAAKKAEEVQYAEDIDSSVWEVLNSIARDAP